MRLHWLFIANLFIANATFSQVQWHSTGAPNGRDVNGIKIFNRDTVLTAGGWMLADSTQSLFKSYNGGLLWDVYIDTNALWLKSVDFSDLKNGITVGAGGRILISTDGGVHWSRVNTPVNRDFNKIYYKSASSLFVAGGKPGDTVQNAMQTILKSTDGGQSWSVVHDQNGPWLKSVYFPGSSLGYAVGDSGTILKTVNGGDIWTPITSPIQRDFNAIWFTDANNGFIVGGNLTNDSLRTILKTTNGGNNWTVNKDELGGWLTDVHFISSNIGYAVGDRATVLKTTNAGLIWTQEALNGAVGDEHFNAVRFFSSDYGWIGGKWGREYVYTVATIPEPFVTGAELIDSTQVFLNGVINTHGEPARFSVIYSDDSLWLSATGTFPGDVKSNGFGPVQLHITGLSPNTSYYYLIQAFTHAGTAYSDTLSFFTGTLNWEFKTEPATDITSSSAKINGTVNGFSTALNLFFEYGNTPAFGNQIAATPPSVNDTLLHSVSANLVSLQPNSLYYFRLKGVSGSAVYYGSSIAFFTGSVYSTLEAQYATVVTDTTATLNGLASGFKVPATISFELSIDSSVFFPIANSVSYSINDSFDHYISIPAAYLLPSTKYFFRLKAVTTLGVFYCAPFYFYTSQGDSRTQTLTATDVTQTSARLNGKVRDFSQPVNLSFQYGTTTLFGNEMQAFPSQINDTSTHDVYTVINGLQSNTLYYYRIKAEGNNGAEFFGGIKQVFVGEPSIPNWDFQLWEEDTVELPYRWFVASEFFERIPGHSGDYAIELHNQNLAILGKFKDKDSLGNGPSFYDGMPFNARPDSVIVWLKYDNLPNDSTTGIIIYLTAQQTIAAEQYCYISGSTGGDFERKAFKIDYQSSLTPDSLMIAILFNQPQQSIAIDDISFSPASPAVINGDFETWFSYPNQSVQNWNYPKFIVFDSVPNSGIKIVKQVYFNQPSDFAAEIVNFDLDGSGNYSPGSISTGLGFIGSPLPSFPVYARHLTLNGYFQYYPVNGDSLSIDVFLTQNGQDVGYGSFSYGDSVAQFEKFSIPINYPNSSFVPDSGIISISSSKNYANGPSRLIIDKLSFDGFAGNIEPIGISESNLQSSFLMYPNPASSSINIKLENIKTGVLEIFDLQGRLMNSRVFSGEKLNVDTRKLKEGVYFIRIIYDGSMLVNKLVVIK